MARWLEGRRALIVGGGSGIGRAVAEAYLAEGARVSVLEIDATKCAATAAAFPGVLVVQGDAASYADDLKAVTAAATEFGGLDVLVNCAGIFDYYLTLEALDAAALDSAFDEVFHVNVRSMLCSVKAALGPLSASANAAVVLTESTSAYYAGRGGSLYVASKFAVRGLVTALAHELAPGIRVNGVAPGTTLNTDMRGPATLGLSDRVLGQVPGRASEAAERLALQTAMSPVDVASSFVFLASDRSRGITGTTLHPDGGAGVSAPRKRS